MLLLKNSDVQIGFSQDDYEGVEGPDGDEIRNNTPCRVIVELNDRRLEIPLRVRFISQTIQQNAASPDDPPPAVVPRGGNATSKICDCCNDRQVHTNYKVHNISPCSI